MDSIPNEILVQIIRCLEKEEIPEMRLVSHRFNLLATECVQKLCRVRFETDSDIAKFVTMFENKEVVPFKKFEFSEAIAYDQPLKQFCARFGEIVKSWSIFLTNDLGFVGKNLVLENVQILLDSCFNVEEIGLTGVERIGTKLPVLLNLKTIGIEQFSIHNEDFLFEKVPVINADDCSEHETAIDILTQLCNMDAKVRVQKLRFSLELPVTNIVYLEKLAKDSTKFSIVDLELSLTFCHPDTFQHQVEILSQWIQDRKSVQRLTLECKDKRYRNDPDVPYVPIRVPLYSVASLPDLTFLCCIYEAEPIRFSFSGCDFPNVKVAQICLNTEEDCQQWPMVLPNVEELGVVSKTLKGIFGFRKLRKLYIQIFPRVSAGDVPEQHWNHLTGGAPHVSDAAICSFPVNTNATLAALDSFRNLPLLRHLKFTRNTTTECWKGIIYASRTGQLQRLEKLAFRGEDFDMRHRYRGELMKYHDSVDFEFEVESS